MDTIVARSAGVSAASTSVQAAALPQHRSDGLSRRHLDGIPGGRWGVGGRVRGGTSVELVATPAGRTGLGGAISA
ncbi:MAG TPA: hypothetical protein VFQ44_16420 [Streptosporangiaceae bacterium]|nr:hypothetical protein [Streptosporangiaceae bacterium]